MNDWKKKLDDKLNKKKEKEIEKKKEGERHIRESEKFFKTVVKPAFYDIKVELEKHERDVKINIANYKATITIKYKNKFEYLYGIEVRNFHPYPIHVTPDPLSGKQYMGEGSFRSGSQDYTIVGITKEEILNDFVCSYNIHII